VAVGQVIKRGKRKRAIRKRSRRTREVRVDKVKTDIMSMVFCQCLLHGYARNWLFVHTRENDKEARQRHVIFSQSVTQSVEQDRVY
jgi:hypothetical protein